MKAPTDPAPRPITLRTLPGLAWRTAMADRDNYRGTAPISPGDVLGSIRPSLRDPVFVIGAPRSGTTFLGDLVAAVPHVSYHFEPVATKAAARYVYEGRWSERRARFFYRAVYRWLLRIHGAGRRRFAEKTPRNCFIVPFLSRAFPDARFLFIVRDGRDAALSHSERPWLQAASAGAGRWEPGGYPYGPHPRFWVEPDRRAEFEATTDIHRCLWAWRRHNEAALEGLAELPDGATFTVRYEGLVTEPEPVAGAILDFLEIRDADARARVLEAAAEASTASIGRWRGELTAADLDRVEAEIGPLLRRLGYEAPAAGEDG